MRKTKTRKTIARKPQAPTRATKITTINVQMPMTFSTISALTNVPANIIGGRYKAFVEQYGKRKIPTVADLTAGYTPRPRRG